MKWHFLKRGFSTVLNGWTTVCPESSFILLLVSGDDLEIKLTDDYFNRTTLDKEYFTLNGITSKIVIDSVVYQDAATAKIYFSDIPEESLEVSVNIHADVLNSWNNLTTNTVVVSIHSLAEGRSNAKVYSELLGSELKIINLRGQLVQSAGTGQALSGGIETNLSPGIYLCLFLYNGKMLTQRIFLNNL